MEDRHPAPEEPPRSSTSRVVAAVLVGLVVIAVIAWLVWLRPEPLPAPAERATPTAETPAPSPTPGLQERLSERLKGVTLATSDAVIRELVVELASHPQVATWLASDDLVRRFAATVNNIATGTSPRPHLEMLRPEGGFQVVERDGRTVVDRRSWRRYDLVADVIASVPTDDAVALYHELLPLLQEAHREIAPPDVSFEERLLEAIDELLATPVPEGDVEVEQKVLTYVYVRPELESLSEPQRHLLRMGPDNMRRVQKALRDFRAALRQAP